MLLRKITDKNKKKKKRKIYKEEYIEEEVFIELPMEQNPHTQTVTAYFEAINFAGFSHDKA